MSKPIIKVENLSKQYILGARQEAYSTFRESMAGAIKAPLKGLRRNGNTIDDNILWALKDVNFEVQQGEVVGIIGRNGAGKSTLLKVLSRITEPTAGSVKLYGRMASLLEVGTGFHPELTGRENIFLNGAILGMGKREIESKFGEIVDFAEVEKFIDTPVKRYSSGMYLRLAFAVAAHLNPEILVVDEVLAVGDATFQKKCLGKMEDVSKREGKTVLFVSHNMGAVNQLCSRGLLLEGGTVKLQGGTQDIISSYLKSGFSEGGERRWPAPQAGKNQKLCLRAIRVLNGQMEVDVSLDIRAPIFIEVEYEVLTPVTDPRICLTVSTSDGTVAFVSTDDVDESWKGKRRDVGTYTSRCQIPANLLNEGSYLVGVAADIPMVEVLFLEENALGFKVEQTGGVSGRYGTIWPGVFCPLLDWNVEKSASRVPSLNGI